MRNRLALYGTVLLILYFCLYIFHWAAPPFDPGVYRHMVRILHLKAFPGASFFARHLRDQSTAAISFTAITALLFLFYFLALRTVSRRGNGGAHATVVCFIVLFATANLLFYPWLSTDIFHYGFIGKTVRVHDANPYVESVRSLGEDEYGKVLYWQDTAIPYGPIALLLYSAIYIPSGDVIVNMWSAKLTAVAFFYGAMICIILCLRRLDPSRRDRALVLLGWNPLVLIEAVANAHNDAAVVFLLALSLLLIVRGRSVSALISLAVSALTKYMTIFLFPLYLGYAVRQKGSSRRKIAGIAAGLAASLIMGMACYYPFWEGWETFAWVGSHLGLAGRSFPWMLGRLRERYQWPSSILHVGSVIALLYAVFLSVRCTTVPRLIRSGALLVMFFLIFCYPFNHPWYLLWALPFVALADSRSIHFLYNACCFFFFMGYYPLLYLTRCEGPGTVWIMSLVTVVPPAILYLYFCFSRRLRMV